MSEVVLRMEFHKNCLDCDLRQIVYGDSYADTDIYCSKENRLVGKRFGPAKDLARPSWCPIIGVLPEQHGRIIDEAVFCENVVKYSHQSTKTIGKALDATPTIIEMMLIDTERSET